MIQTQKEYTQKSNECYRRESRQAVIDGFKKELAFKDQVIKEKTVLIKQLKKMITNLEQNK